MLRRSDLDYTLIHEFGHLLTLKAEQVPPSRGGGRGCPTYNPGEGCAISGSYLARYIQDFWQSNGLLAEWEQAQRSRRGLNSFYQRNRDAFVTSYAVSHPAEDIAESFTGFVLRDAYPEYTLADRKVAFFNRFPELVALRAEIRTDNPSPVDRP